jgi:hypothetical protein
MHNWDIIITQRILIAPQKFDIDVDNLTGIQISFS